MTKALLDHPVVTPTTRAIDTTQLTSTPATTSARLLQVGCSLVAFLLPIKLSLTYIVLTPLILLWAYINKSRLIALTPPPQAKAIAAPMCAFLLVAVLSGTVGVSLTHSLPALLSLLFFALTVPLFASNARPEAVCFALIAGQTLAALHSCVDAAIPGTIPGKFLGKVTESGQLALTIPLTLGLIISEFKNKANKSAEKISSSRLLLPLLGIIVTTSLTLLGFQSEVSLPNSAQAGLVIAIIACLIIAWRSTSGTIRSLRHQAALMVVSLPLLTCALLVNLKRGPWLGVLVGTSCLLAFYARRLIIPLALAAVVVAVAVTPVRDRLLSSYDHFTIEGGRSTIWRIGAELAAEYPLGIGYHNSGILREFAPEIPAELKHFHNNLLNIAAETGWLGVSVFVWLLVEVLRICFRDRMAPLHVSIGAAVISWQVAGLVEYNFGDSEVTIVFWVLLGLILHRELQRA